MAINIYQGDKGSRKPVNTAQSSVRATQVKEALAKPAEASDSGNTAVAKQGTLSKVGNFVGKAAGVVSKFLPGIGGTIAKGISNLFNDPEWWQSIPGDAVTLNTPLRTIELDEGLLKIRPTILEFRSSIPYAFEASEGANYYPTVILPTDTMVTQYLLPEIRKVVNAVPLQDAKAYTSVLMANATLYALWRQLRKYDYMLKHGQTYIASMNDIAFPLFRTENAAYLQSMIGRLEEFLRSNVRLPHTLCEYLSWRYGRVYKSTNSAKAALVIYDVVDITAPLTGADGLDSTITYLMGVSTSTTARQQANADLYNAYFDHDQSVTIADDTQFKYDLKEFMLRTNLDLYVVAKNPDNDNPNAVYIDSSMDNPTTFMASTVSTIGRDLSSQAGSALFPVQHAYAYIPKFDSNEDLEFKGWTATQGESVGKLYESLGVGSTWGMAKIQPFRGNDTEGDMPTALGMLVLCKALDLYNKDIYLPVYSKAKGAIGKKCDVTALSMDMGLVADSVIANEHVYAFANLVHVSRKLSTSYSTAEKLVAKDTANLIDTLDVAAKPSSK